MKIAVLKFNSEKRFYRSIFLFVLLICISYAASASTNAMIISKLNGFDPHILDNSDLVYFDKIISDAKVVALGESTHGTKEFFQMKHRLLKHLVEHQGFTIFAMEQEMATSSQLNQYVLNGIGDPKQILMQMNAPYACQELLDLINWIREYNKTALKKVQFFGFDCQSDVVPASNVITFIKQSGNKQLEYAFQEINKKIIFFNREYNLLHIAGSSGHISPEIKQQARKFIIESIAIKHELDQFILKLILNKKSLEEKLGHDNFEWLLQNVKLCEERCTLSGLEIDAEIFKGNATIQQVNFRDRMMAKNVMWLIQQNPNSKIVLWAHNTHIEAAPQLVQLQLFIPMGAHLKKNLINQYRTINFSTYEGTYTAVNLQKMKFDLLPLQIPPTSSLEYTVDQIAYPQSLINFRDKSNLPSFLTNTITQRGIGWAEEVDQFQEKISNTSLAFDGIIYFRDTVGSHNFYADYLKNH